MGKKAEKTEEQDWAWWVSYGRKATSPHKEGREYEFLMSGGEGSRRAGEKAIDGGYFR